MFIKSYFIWLSLNRRLIVITMHIIIHGSPKQKPKNNDYIRTNGAYLGCSY